MCMKRTLSQPYHELMRVQCGFGEARMDAVFSDLPQLLRQFWNDSLTRLFIAEVKRDAKRNSNGLYEPVSWNECLRRFQLKCDSLKRNVRILASISKGTPKTVEQIADESGEDTGRVLALLVRLVEGGRVEESEGGYEWGDLD